MKPFVVNRYGRIVFPESFFPELDFSVFDTLEQFAAVIKRDFEEKAPSETDIVARVEAREYGGRYELLRDLALNLFWVNRYAMTMYEKRPTRWRDVARQRDDVFLPVFKPWDGTELTAAIESGYRALKASWDEGTEDKICRILLDVFRHKKGAGAELPAIKPTVAELLARPKSLTYHLLAYDPDYPGYGHDDIIEFAHAVPELEAVMRQAMVLHNQYRWNRARTRLTEVGQLHDDDYVVVFHPRNEDVLQFIRRVKSGQRARPRRPAPAESVRPIAPYPPVLVAKRFSVLPRLESLAVYKGSVPAPTRISSATPPTVGPRERGGDLAQDRHPAAAVHRAGPRPHRAARRAERAGEVGTARGGDRGGDLLLLHEREDDAVPGHLALRAARSLPDACLGGYGGRLRGPALRARRRCGSSRRSSARCWWYAARSSPTRSAPCGRPE